MTKTTVRRLPRENIDLVLGAGGVEGPAHIGVLRCLEERHVSLDRLTITGASVGALIGTFIANGYDSNELKKIFLSESFRFPSWDIWSKCLHTPNPSQWFFPMSFDPNVWANYYLNNMWPWTLDFRPWLEHVVNEYKLSPKSNLRLVAADALANNAPIVFEGTDYDLVEGLAAATAAISGLGLRPIWVPSRHPHKDGKSTGCHAFGAGHLAVDGFYYHPIPAALCDTKPAIVSKIGFASRPPSERLGPWDLFMHMREMALAPYFAMKYPDPEGHIIIEAGMPNVASTNFGVSLRTLEELIEHGYKAACERLDSADGVALLSK